MSIDWRLIGFAAELFEPVSVLADSPFDQPFPETMTASGSSFRAGSPLQSSFVIHSR
jgi:hypothetical protein